MLLVDIVVVVSGDVVSDDVVVCVVNVVDVHSNDVSE